MSWLRQVLHVARKDFRSSRWLLGAYVLLIATVTGAVLGLLPPVLPGFDLTTLLLIGLGMLAVVTVVQADSPLASDAFWATRPLHPLAVFGAKLLVAGAAVLGAGLLGQLAVLLAHDVPRGDLMPVLGDTAAVYAPWLAFAALAGAVTKDVRSFVVTAILAIVAMGSLVALQATRSGVYDPTRGVTPGWVLVGATVALLAGAAVQYRLRDARPGRAAAGVAGVVVALLLLYSPRPGVPIRTAEGAEAPGWLRAQLQPPVAADSRALQISVSSLGSEPGRLYVLLHPEVWLELDGRMERLTSLQPFVRVEAMVSPARDPAAATRPDMPPYEAVHQVIGFLVSSREMDAIRNGAPLSVKGVVQVRVPEPLLELPLHAGAGGARNGHRVRVLSVDPAAGPVVARTSWVGRRNAAEGLMTTMFMATATVGYELYNERLQERRQLHPEFRGAASLLLPGPDSWSFETGVSSTAVLLADTADTHAAERRWLNDARLRVIRWATTGVMAVDVPVERAAAR